MATSLGTIQATFAANASPFMTAAGQVRQATSGMTSDLRRGEAAHRSFGSSLLGAVSSFGQWTFWAGQAVNAVGGFVEGLFSQNAAMEQTRIGFKGLLGGAAQADAMLKQLQAFAARTPFEFPELAKDTQMLLGMGFAASDIIPTMTAVGDAVAGVGQGAEGVQRAVIALGQMQARGKITADDMMQLTELGIPAWRLLADAMGISVAQVQDLSAKGLIPAQQGVAALVKGMEKMYGGQMAGQATTFNGLVSTLKDNFNMAWQSFLTPAFNAARAGLAELVKWLGNPAVMTFATQMGQGVGQAIAFVATGIGQIIGYFSRLNLNLSQAAGAASQFGAIFQTSVAGAVNFVNAAIKAAQPVIAAFGTVWTTNIVPALQSLVGPILSLLSALEQVRQAILRGVAEYLPAMGAALGRLITAIGPVVADILRFAGSVAQFLAPAIAQMAPVFGQAAGAVMQFAVEVIDRVGPAITGLWNELKGFLAWLTPVWNAVWPSLSVLLQGVWQGIVGIVQTAWAIVSGIIKIGLDLLAGDWGRAWKDLQAMCAGAWTGIQNIFGGAVKVVLGFVSGLVNGIVAFFQQLWRSLVGGSIVPDIVNGITSWFTRMRDNLFGIVNAVRDTVLSVWNTLSRSLTDLVVRLVTTITDRFRPIGDAILAPFRAAQSAIGGVVRGMGNMAIDAFNGMLGGVSSFLGFFADAINTVARAVGAGSPVGRPSIGRISRLAEGTQRWAGGAAIVGERGPELVYLPAGAAVLPAGATDVLIRSGAQRVPGLAAGVGLMDIVGWLGGGAAGVFSHLFNATLSFPGIFGGVASSVIGLVRQWGVDMVGKLLGNITAAVGSVFGGGAGAPGNVTSWILSAIAATGVPVSWLGALTTIAMHESGGNPASINLWDINAIRGTPSIGLFQTIGPTFAAYAMAGHGNIYNPVDNAIAAIRYIIGRYGSVYNVPGIVSMSRGGSYVGYAGGGLIAEEILGVGTRSGQRYRFGETGPEMVTPLGWGRGVTINLVVDGRTLAQALGSHMVQEIKLVVGGRGGVL